MFYSGVIIHYKPASMQRFAVIFTQNWYLNLHSWQKELIQIAIELYSREERMHSSFTDYSFIVFPMAKAYEGFLKQYFYNMGLIDERTYNDKRFRIGRALNPDLDPSRRDDQWMYGRIMEMCGVHVARQLWDTWLQCRNQVFHYFPANEKRLSLIEAGKYLELMATTIEQAAACQLAV